MYHCSFLFSYNGLKGKKGEVGEIYSSITTFLILCCLLKKEPLQTPPPCGSTSHCPLIDQRDMDPCVKGESIVA